MLNRLPAAIPDMHWKITRSHAGAFPEKEIEWLHELVDGNRVAHQVRFVLVH
jgi:hypothetical protein